MKELEKPVTYQLEVNGLIVNVSIENVPFDSVAHYKISILNISPATEIIMNKIRDEFISKVNIASDNLGESDSIDAIRSKFSHEILFLLRKYLPKIDKQTSDLLINYLITQNIGLGNVEILLRDANLEEIVVNNHTEPLWVYHRKYGWLKTNVKIP